MAEENVGKNDSKRKRGSKKNKKNWRKKVDIEDVEEHLEDIRMQERTGGIVSEKLNEDLFFIEKDNKVVEQNARDLKEKSDSSDEEEYISRKERMKLKEQQKLENEKKEMARIKPPSDDVWSKKENDVSSNDWVNATIPVKPKKPKTVGEKKLNKNAMQLCHPGASYNPDFEDHQNLLNDALSEEIIALKKQEKLNKSLKYLSEKEFNQKSQWMEEMSEGLVEKGRKKIEVKVEPDEEGALPKAVNAEDRKTNRMRRKERQQIEEEKSKQEEKLRRVKLNDIYRLRSLKRELKEKETELKEKRKKKAELESRKNSKPKRLGRLKYEDPKLDFQLSEELSGSLRGLKSEGDPFKDRIKSLEKCGIIEPRKRVIPHRKYKEKFVEKRSYSKPTVKDSISIKN